MMHSPSISFFCFGSEYLFQFIFITVSRKSQYHFSSTSDICAIRTIIYGNFAIFIKVASHIPLYSASFFEMPTPFFFLLRIILFYCKPAIDKSVKQRYT